MAALSLRGVNRLTFDGMEQGAAHADVLVNTDSGGLGQAQPSYAVFCASKLLLRGYLKPACKELATTGGKSTAKSGPGSEIAAVEAPRGAPAASLAG